VDPNTGELLRTGQGGVMPRWKARVQAKYTKEARGCYGIACPTVDGESVSQFMETWDYTKTTLLSFKQYKSEEATEQRYQWGMKASGWEPYNGETPYQGRFGNNWQDHIKTSPRMQKYM
jgi:hypothetical protein